MVPPARFERATFPLEDGEHHSNAFNINSLCQQPP